MENLHGKLVCTTCDILVMLDRNNTEEWIEEGTEFIWNDVNIDQNINGMDVFVDNSEVELVDDD